MLDETLVKLLNAFNSPQMHEIVIMGYFMFFDTYEEVFDDTIEYLLHKYF